MRLLEREPTAALPGSKALLSVRLRMRADGRMVDLPLGKTAIGSGPRCNLRIQEPGIQPIHCLIVHAVEGLSVRRWAGEARLNGEPFDESSLDAGDCLSVGPVELEIVIARPETTPNEPTVIAMPNREAADRLCASRALARSRSRKLLAAIRRDRATHRELGQRVADLEEQIRRVVAEGERTAAELRSASAELANARTNEKDHQAFAAARHELAHENRQLGREVGELTDRIDRLTGELTALAAARQALEEEKAAVADERGRLFAENFQLREQCEQLTNQNSALCRKRDELGLQAEMRHGAMQSLAHEKATLTDEKAVVCGERDALREKNEELQANVRALADERAALSGERDALREQNEQLQTNVRALAHESATLADERAAVYSERDGLREQNGQLQANVRELADEKASLAHDFMVLCGERDELLEQNEQLQTNVRTLAHEKATLADDFDVLCGERDGYRQQFERLQSNVQTLAEEKTALAEELASRCGERDGYRQQFERLQSNVQMLVEEKTALAEEIASRCGERDELRRQSKQLQAKIDALAGEKADLVNEQTALAGECDRLRQEAQRLEDLERQLRAAVADRENTSSELYRALLQLAEMKEHDDHRAALAEAHHALSEELEKSFDEVAQLQTQIDRLSDERAAADDARQALASQTAEFSEAQQRLANENAELVASLAEARQQLEEALRQQTEFAASLQAAESWRQTLEEAQRNQIALAETIVRLEDELASKQQAEAAAAATIVGCEREIADHARQLADSTESIRRLERQLAAAEQVHEMFEQARDEWQRECSNASRQAAEQSQQIAALEGQLAAEKAATASALASVVSPGAETWDNQSPAPAECPTDEQVPAADVVADVGCDRAAPLADVPAGEFDWSTLRASTGTFDASQSENDAEAREIPAAAESTVDDSNWGRPSQVEESAHTSENDRDGGFVGEDWDQSATFSAPIAEANSGWGSEAPLESDDVTSASAASPPPIRETIPATPQTPPLSQSAKSDSEKTESKSFIERYSHMFTEDDATNEESPAPAGGQRPAGMSGARKPGATGVVGSGASPLPSPAAEDEESIEQYMAKLLQRVRGETQAPPTAQFRPTRVVPNSASLGHDAMARAQTTTLAGASPSNRDSQPLNGREFEPAPDFDAGMRRSSVSAPQTDLEALRALANETARRAISRHALRKHRRNALTKVIVSTLAGVTSLWLMLQSPDWRSVQFITACLSLMVAAYWAGETFRTLLESLRAAAYDGPEDEDEMDEFTAQLHAPLPIDIDTPLER